MNEAAATSLWRRLELDPDADMASLVTATDQTLSIGQDVWRLLWRNQITTAVGSDADLHTTCGAVLDALAMFETDRNPSVDRSTVNVLIDRRMPDDKLTETDQAVRSMRDATVDVAIRVWYRRDEDSWADDTAPAPTWPAEDPKIKGWVKDLLLPRLNYVPHRFALGLVELVDDPSLQLYPSEIKKSSPEVWALRIDGLEIGTVRPTSASLGIGKPGKSGDGPQRSAFIEVFGQPNVAVVDESTSASQISVREAAIKIRELLRRFRDADVRGAPITHRTKSAGVRAVDEHTLEARLLKGIVRLGQPANGLVRDDQQVARGSQFPTLWGHGGRARYLDALVTVGTTPVAVELKVATGGQGRYYRRSLVQAVLYRHFLTHTDDLQRWFKAAELDRHATQAAIAVPVPVRWTAQFAATHDLLIRVAAHVNTTVHLLDDRTTPERRHLTLPEPDHDLIEPLSWQLAAALSKRWPRSLGRIVELHEFDGQYDQLQLQPVTDRSLSYPSPGPRISLNRNGSTFVFSPISSWRWVWRDIWAHLAAGGDVDAAADDLGTIAGLGPPESVGSVVFAELATTFLDKVSGTDWSWRCAWIVNEPVAPWVDPYQPQLRRYRHTADVGMLPTIARVWGATRDGGAPVIVDQDNLRVWITDEHGCHELTDADPLQRIERAAELMTT